MNTQIHEGSPSNPASAARGNPQGRHAAGSAEEPASGGRRTGRKASTGGIFFLVNNRAGGADEARIRAEIVSSVEVNPQRWELFMRTQKSEDRVEITRQAVADGYTTIVAVGGDGTVSQVANGLAGTDAVLGIVPTGTANLVANALDVPLSITEALRLISHGGPIRAVDGMRVGDTTFFSHISAGVYSRITKKEGKLSKKALGRAVYLWHLFRELGGGSRWNFDLELDDRRMSVTASIVMAANVAATGLGQVKWGQQIDPGNRGLDVCIVQARTIPQYLSLLYDAVRGRQSQSPHIRYERVDQRFRISGPPGMPIRGDGRRIGKGEVTIELVPRTLNVIAPARSDLVV